MIPEFGRAPGEGNGNPLHHSCLESSNGERSQAGDSLWGLKESDMTERLSLHFTSLRTLKFLFVQSHQIHHILVISDHVLVG